MSVVQVRDDRLPARRGFRRALSRFALIALLLAGAYLAYAAASGVLAARGIGTGFAFLANEAGFAIGEKMPLPVLNGPAWLFAAFLLFAGLAGLGVKLVATGLSPRQNHLLTLCLLGVLALLCVLFVLRAARLDWIVYAQSDSFALAMLTGFANTVKVSFFGCILATVVGISVGLARLSSNWLVSRTAALFVETLRNVPLLIQVFFWYFGVIRALPNIRQSIDIFGVAALNNRGMFLPEPVSTAATLPFIIALVAGIAAFVVLCRRAARMKLATGRFPRWSLLSPFLAAALPLGVWGVLGVPVEFSIPVLKGFNFVGGIVTTPEFTALLVGLGFYSAAFIAEIVRGGIQGVDPGQSEAARALGLGKGRIMRLVIFPQALKVMFPPLITQYLSLIKDSSLGFAIAYPELVSINNVMVNQTGQPIEILTVTIGVFVLLNLLVTLILRRFEQANAWVSR